MSTAGTVMVPGPPPPSLPSFLPSSPASRCGLLRCSPRRGGREPRLCLQTGGNKVPRFFLPPLLLPPCFSSLFSYAAYVGHSGGSVPPAAPRRCSRYGGEVMGRGEEEEGGRARGCSACLRGSEGCPSFEAPPRPSRKTLRSGRGWGRGCGVLADLFLMAERKDALLPCTLPLLYCWCVMCSHRSGSAEPRLGEGTQRR